MSSFRLMRKANSGATATVPSPPGLGPARPAEAAVPAKRPCGERHASARIALTQGLESRSDFRWVMPVVINDRHPARSSLDIRNVLQSAIDTLEARQRALNRRVFDTKLTGHDDGRQRVQNIVGAWQVDGHVERRARGTHDIVGRLQTMPADIHSSDIRVL